MWRVILAGVTCAAWLAAASPATACSCARNPTAAGILSSATAVFTATVADTETAGKNVSITTFRITEAFKGPAAGSTVKVRHRSDSSASCGVKFMPGESYTLAAYRSENEGAMLSANLCSTWMFMPQVGLSKGLIESMRKFRKQPEQRPQQ